VENKILCTVLILGVNLTG